MATNKKGKDPSTETLDYKTFSGNVAFPITQNTVQKSNTNNITNKAKNGKALKQDLIRLTIEKKEVMSKFEELHTISFRKIKVLKKKLAKMEMINKTIINERDTIRKRNQELTRTCSNLQSQLDQMQNCVKCDEMNETFEKLAIENKTINSRILDKEEDVQMLKNVVFRLSEQLERYQNKIRHLHTSNDPEGNSKGSSHNDSNFCYPVKSLSTDDLDLFRRIKHTDHTHLPVTWGSVNRHTLGPLLDAYINAINEKDEIISQYVINLSNFISKVKEITSENELLHDLLNKEKCQNEDLISDTAQDRKQLEVLRNEYHREINTYSDREQELREHIKYCENTVNELKTEHQELNRNYAQIQNENEMLKSKNKVLTTALVDFQNQTENCISKAVHISSLNECKRLHDEFKIRYERHQLDLQKDLNQQKESVDELTIKLSKLSNEKHESHTKLKTMQVQIRSYEKERSHLNKLVNELHVSKCNCRKQLQKVMNFAKDIVEEQETLLTILNSQRSKNTKFDKE